jgi:predicted HTH transcriptional regulator
MTNREFLNAVIALSASEEITEHAKAMIASLDKRNAARTSKPSKTQLENAPIKEAILGIIAEMNAEVSASELHERLNISVQKASSLCRQLVEEGKLSKGERKEKGKGLVKVYSLAEDSSDEEVEVEVE